MRDWRAIANAAGLKANEAELDRIVMALSGLDATFRPLLADLSPEIEPATLFRAGETGA